MVLDMAALGEPGHDRGLGRYSRTLRAAVAELASYDVVEYRGREGSRHRFSEWLDIPARSRFVAAYGPFYHATSAYHLDPLHLGTTIVSIQDLIPLELAAYRKSGAKARLFFSWVRRCPVIVTSSHYSMRRIEQILGVPPERIIVAALPVLYADSETACTRCREIPSSVTAYVASNLDLRTPDHRKRFPWLLGAARLLAEQGIRVVLFGDGTAELEESNVVGLGRVCDVHMRQVLAGARCFLYASAYEGQGLPPQEALLEGTPVVAFRNTSIEEMVGPGAVWLEEPAESWSMLTATTPEDPQARELAHAAIGLFEDEPTRERLASAGREHVQGFTIAAFAQGIDRAHQMLLSR
jgi:glycosyltransferase involved in cell wall biosynthesis